MSNTFAELGLSERTLEALRDVGYESPSPIQEQAIPSVLQGRDVIGQAQTGTGKTAAFGLPIVEYVDPELHEVQALVLTPTRELCIQVTQALRAYGAHDGRGRRGGVRRRADPHPAGAAARRRARGRGDGRARARPDLAPFARACTTAASWCSTRPTRCLTWGSWRTSRRSSRSRPRAGRRRCSARRCPRRSASSRTSTCMTRC